MSVEWPGFHRGVLMLVTEPTPDLPRIVGGAVAGGVNLVQWRDRTTPDIDFKALGPLMHAVLGDETLLIVNRDARAAEDVHADGLHVPEQGPPVYLVRRVLGKHALVGRSVHSVERAVETVQEGGNYVVAGTIFASPSHPDIAPAGIEFLRAVCAAVHKPVLAIGGVTPKRVRDCIAAGAAGVAVLSPIMRAADPRSVAREYRAALDAAWEERTCR